MFYSTLKRVLINNKMKTIALQQAHDTDGEIIRKHVMQYGLSVVIHEATDYMPSFAYSIGLWKNYQHPEIIAFGLTEETLHVIISIAAEQVQEGKPLQTGQDYDLFFDRFKATFITVDPAYIGSYYFREAVSYYHTAAFPVQQLVWVDRHNRYPWEEGFEAEFIYKQPLLDRNTDFQFREPADLKGITTRAWAQEGAPILQVVHEEDGNWKFLTPDYTTEDITTAPLKELLQKDHTLNEVFNLGYGEAAQRSFVGGPWVRVMAG